MESLLHKMNKHSQDQWPQLTLKPGLILKGPVWFGTAFSWEHDSFLGFFFLSQKVETEAAEAVTPGDSSRLRLCLFHWHNPSLH